MSTQVKKEVCVGCRMEFYVLLEIKAFVEVLDVTCPYCKKVGEVTATKVLRVERKD